MNSLDSVSPPLVFGDAKALRAGAPLALTIGTFDGVHLGHRFLLDQLLRFCAGGMPVAMTFDPHPSELFTPLSRRPLLLPLEERVALLQECGARAVLVQKFDRPFAQLSAEDFVTKNLSALGNLKRVLLGYDFSFGRDRRGGAALLSQLGRDLGWQVRSCPPRLWGDEPVSSTRIRKAVEAQDIGEANAMLGQRFRVFGTVVKGDQRGRLLGFPTANLAWRNEVLPGPGVYRCFVELEGEPGLLPAVMNCGYRPTIKPGPGLAIEAHILDFSRDIYGRRAIYHVDGFVRGEKKFGGLDELKLQIEHDVAAARAAFRQSQGHDV